MSKQNESIITQTLSDYFSCTEKFSKYLPDFIFSASKFALATGQIKQSMSGKDLLKSFHNQALVVQEEITEFHDANAIDDRKEIMDAVIDTIYTVGNFELLYQLLSDKQCELNEEEQVEVIAVFSIIQTELANLLNALYVYQEETESFTDEELYLSARLIEENNNLKYTNNVSEFMNWEIDDTDGLETKRVTTEVDHTLFNGEVYYCLKDMNGKVRKHKSFKKVDLGFIEKTIK